MAEERLSKIQKEMLQILFNSKRRPPDVVYPIEIRLALHERKHGYKLKSIGKNYYRWEKGFISESSFYRSLQNLFLKGYLQRVSYKTKIKKTDVIVEQLRGRRQFFLNKKKLKENLNV